jgi:hypothetical protein
LGAAVHSSDGEDEFGEGVRDPMPWIDVGAQFVMTVVEILDEGLSHADYSRRAQPLQLAHGPQSGFQAAVICLDRVGECRGEAEAEEAPTVSEVKPSPTRTPQHPILDYWRVKCPSRQLKAHAQEALRD